MPLAVGTTLSEQYLALFPLVMAPDYLLGFDIGGTKCAAILGRAIPNSSPQLLARQAFATRETPSPDAVLKRLSLLAREMIARQGLKHSQIGGAGVSCGGPLDSASGTVHSPPNLPGWDRVPVTQTLQDALGLPVALQDALGLPVALQNDANACALAEWHWGAGQGSQTMAFLTFGTGLGAGLIIGGRLHAGRDDLAGELGHWRLAPDGPIGFGKAGSFEGFCSGGGIERLAAQKAHERDLRPLSLPELAQAARCGDVFAREIFEICGDHLGRGLALLIDLLNPEAIVIGSVFTRCEDLLRPPMTRALESEALPPGLKRCRIAPAALGEQIGDYGALAVALQLL